MRRVHVLQVGINEYPPASGVPSLKGCLNDIDQLQAWLQQACGHNLALAQLKDAEATRANVLQHFCTHLGRAEAGDVALFHYAGHGGQGVTADEFKALTGDPFDEGLVLHDSRLPGGRDLVDKELAVLIDEIAQRGVQVVVVLDSCHSGDGTRDADALGRSDVRARLAPSRSDGRPLETYLDGHYARLLERGEPLAVPAARHLLMAACERGQTAKESQCLSLSGAWVPAGAFTTALVHTLRGGGGQLSYAALQVQCGAKVRSWEQTQDPQFEPRGGFDIWEGFLGGAAAPDKRLVPMYFDKTRKTWTLQAGALDGLGDEPEHPVAVQLVDPADTYWVLARGCTDWIGLWASTVTLDEVFGMQATALEQGGPWVALLGNLPTPPLRVWCADAGLREAWQSTPGSATVQLVSDKTDARYALLQEDGHQVLTRVLADGDLLAAPQPIGPPRPIDAAGPAAAVAAWLHRLLAVARYEAMLAARNRERFIEHGAVHLEAGAFLPRTRRPYRVQPGPDLTLQCGAASEGTAATREAEFNVRNHGSRVLHCVLLQFSSDCSVDVHEVGALEPGAALRTPRFAFAPRQNAQGRLVAATTRFKLLLTENPIPNPALLGQPGLNAKAWSPAARTRDATLVLPMPDTDWAAIDITVRALPPDPVVTATEDGVLAGGAVVVRRHPRVAATVRWAEVASDTRDAGEAAPFIAAFARAGLQPLTLQGEPGTRSAVAGNVLELSGMQTTEALRDAPLEIALQPGLADDECLLAFASDGTLALPAGRLQRLDDGSVVLRISELPDTAPGERSVSGALKLLFFKAVLRMQRVNRLSWLHFAPDHSWVRHTEGLAAQVAAARRVVLLVHGIIGDTEGIADHARSLGLDSRFDLVLAYDYENLHTPVEETARQLKAALAEVGLQAGAPQKLTVLAHSMGGLVSRWFIEREGGHALVEHLVMCGTPNQGSPFSDDEAIARWVQGLLALAANRQPAALPDVGTLAWVLSRPVAALTVVPTLARMHMASDLIAALNASPDPGVRYSIVAGDAAAALEPGEEGVHDLVARLARKGGFVGLYQAEAHDVAVAVDSITNVGAARARPPAVQRVTCHHLNYFASGPGRRALHGIDW